MPDVYAAITEADPEVVERIAEILELRASDEHGGSRIRGHQYQDLLMFPRADRSRRDHAVLDLVRSLPKRKLPQRGQSRFAKKVL